MTQLPPEVVESLLACRGPAARPWLERLPTVLDRWAERWSLHLGAPYAGLSFNYVTRATLEDGTPVTLKVGIREENEFGLEPQALEHVAGSGMVALLRRAVDDDGETQLLLLERVEPGVPLATLEDDEQATTIAADVMRRIWRPVSEPHGFPTVADWERGFARHLSLYGAASPIPSALFERGRALYRELAATSAPPVLLHGDLHHDNILSATREPWLAIDPKGVAGEPAYETGALLRNPHKRLAALPDARSLLARRIALLADALGIERARIHGWGLATAVLSACWTFEDGPDSDASIALGVASALARISAAALGT